ncbi:ATP-binding protein [Desulfosporosinus youngiae]|uniref:Uncharacterized protein n=1 Tax=Desulfosporosinus youngiae DSM 17734 TaxID=768710 RepID=H5XUT8_9FIRM|nr:hypothetical protein [Desulfosporosinus youngiae]EHQ89245.1 hypothetical protein DesyoDRAFT_2160 [Desulfosporosinus youngiae DSM 17734]
MRIERIRINNLWGLGDVDWIFPSGPVLLLFQNKSDQRLFGDVLLTLFYDQELPLPKEQIPKAAAEVWLTCRGDGPFDTGYHIRHEIRKRNHELEQFTTLIDETGQIVGLPERMKIGDYLYKAQLQAFQQGGLVEWPEIDHYDSLVRRIHNLSQGGDEGLSFKKVQASIAGAQMKLQDQKEKMALVKAEYDTLRLNWETAHRHQDDERLLQIELKNLKEQELILSEKIASAASLQKRLELLSQNPDYRELRQLQDEITCLEERLQSLEASLTEISSDTVLDNAVIEGLREECLEWGCFQKNLSSSAAKIQACSSQILNTQNLLQASGYEGLSDNEDVLLKRAEEERDKAQEKLNKLLVEKGELDKLRNLYNQEQSRFENLAVMAGVTEADMIRIAQKEKQLEMWRDSKVGGTLDRTLRKRLGVKSIAERLSSYLLNYYEQYQVRNYQEFTSQLKQYADQKESLERMKDKLEKLQKEVSQESHLIRIVNSRNERLKHAFSAVQAADLSEWLNGWQDYQRKKQQLTAELNELNAELKQQSILEEKLAACSEVLRDKLKSWGVLAEVREEALEAVLKIAHQLQERDEAKKEISEFTERFYSLLGDRDMVQLSNSLEPLAELEREKRLTDEERLAEMSAWDKEQAEIRQNLVVLKQRLQNNRKGTSLSVLEKEIEDMKRQWLSYEDLRHALEDVQVILELSWQEWQTKHAKRLSEEKQWIYEQCFLVPALTTDRETISRRAYFSYRMAVAQLALHVNTEVPLLFSVGKIKEEDQRFWLEVAGYLQKLSLSRQVVFSITDSKLSEKLYKNGWSLLAVES